MAGTVSQCMVLMLSCTLQVGPIVYSASSELSRTTYPGAIRNGTSILSAYALPGSEAHTKHALSEDNIQGIDFTAVDINARGIAVTIEKGGQIGRVSLRAIVITLTSGIVLVQFAGAIVQVCRLLHKLPQPSIIPHFQHSDSPMSGLPCAECTSTLFSELHFGARLACKETCTIVWNSPGDWNLQAWKASMCFAEHGNVLPRCKKHVLLHSSA
jgi:hypothetical protein